MKKICPSCQSTKIKKNGKTHYGKQNHKCKECGRQFVLHNKHTKSETTKNLIKRSLMERLSLRAICRIFKISFNWLHSFAISNWGQTPSDLGLDKHVLNKIKSLQVFGIQADEMWSFVKKKIEKRWIWIAYDPVHRLVIAYYIGKRDKNAAIEFWKKIPESLKKCNFETDDWAAYKSIIPSQQHRVGKDLTYFIEGFNTTIRARVSRLVRKTLSFSKLDCYHDAAIGWFFWQINLERTQPYI